MSKLKVRNRRYKLPGLHINDAHGNITEQILNGHKIAETRTNNRLDPYMGEWIGLIQTGRGPAKLVGFAKVACHSMATSSYEEFHMPMYETAHRIERGSFYDMKTNKRKYVYWLENVQPIMPMVLPPETFKGDRTFRELDGFVKTYLDRIGWIHSDDSNLYFEHIEIEE